MTAQRTAGATAVDPQGLLHLSRRELEELYRRSPMGAIPVGETQGAAIIAPNTWLGRAAVPFIRWFWWQGKVFNPARQELRNRVSPLRLQMVRARVYPGESWLDGQPAIVLDYAETSLVARRVRDEIREVAPGLYLGMAFWRRRLVARFTLRAGG